MYDLNLTVPNLTSQKYSNDNRFLLLKNYLYELNEVLAFALGDKPNEEIVTVKRTLEEQAAEEKQKIVRLNSESKKRFGELKEQILRVADQVTTDYTTAIEQSENKIMQTAQGQFATKTELGDYKNQVATELSQTAESISAVAGTSEEIATELENYKKSSNAALTLYGQELLTQVESIYATRADAQELEERVASQVSQTATGITESFSEELKGIQADLSSVGGEVSELVSSLDVYIRRGLLEDGVYGIELGRSDSSIKARLTNDRLSFFQGLYEVAYVSGSNLYITRAEILDYLKMGNSTDGYFTFDITANGLEVTWSDGN